MGFRTCPHVVPILFHPDDAFADGDELFGREGAATVRRPFTTPVNATLSVINLTLELTLSMPATIDDPAILDEIGVALKGKGVGV